MKRHVDPWGRVQFDGADAVELLMRGCDLPSLLLTPTDSIAEYNHVCRRFNKLRYVIPPMSPLSDSPAEHAAQRLATWLIPEEFRALDVHADLLARCRRPDEIARVEHELRLFAAHDLMPVLRLMIYLVAHFRQHNIVWGVGRGSSVASYCLFLIGVHKIDSLAYRLPIEEFLKDK
jgi:DNA polymerase III alpha subunit